MVGCARCLPWRGKQASAAPSATSDWFQWALASASDRAADRPAPFRAMASPGMSPGTFDQARRHCRGTARRAGSGCVECVPPDSAAVALASTRRHVSVCPAAGAGFGSTLAGWAAGSAARRVLLRPDDAPVSLCAVAIHVLEQAWRRNLCPSGGRLCNAQASLVPANVLAPDAAGASLASRGSQS
jgi:hypothetical protein